MYFKNFKFSEIFVHCTKNEIVNALGNQNVMSNILDLLHLLQQIRDGERRHEPIFINSGYRDTAHNKRAGGVPSSQHLLGQAADIRNDYNCADVASGIRQFLRDDANKGHIGQVIVYLPQKCKADFEESVSKKEFDHMSDWELASCYCDSFIHVALPNEKYNTFTPSIIFK